MSINVYNIEQAILDKMSNSSSEFELLEYSKMLTELKTGIVQVVDTFNDLPDFSISIGHLYYVKAEKSIYVAMPQTGWENIGAYPASMRYAMGNDNFRGELGTGDNFGRTSWVREISNTTNWCRVFAGYRTAGGIKSDGTLWFWGISSTICGGNQCRSSPIQYGTDTDWCYVNIQPSGHGVKIKTDNRLFITGCNGTGQIGDNSTSSRVDYEVPGANWIKSNPGYRHTVSLKTDGTVWSMGCNNVGQLGSGDVVCYSSPIQEISSSTNWCDISAGRCFNAALKSDGTLWAWGRGQQGAMADGFSVNRSSPVREISSSTNWSKVTTTGCQINAIKNDGTLWCRTGCSLIQESCSSTTWCLVNSGSNSGSASAIKTDGTLWSWGSNNQRQLADGTNINSASPVQELFSLTDWVYVEPSTSTIHALRLTNP